MISFSLPCQGGAGGIRSSQGGDWSGSICRCYTSQPRTTNCLAIWQTTKSWVRQKNTFGQWRKLQLKLLSNLNALLGELIWIRSKVLLHEWCNVHTVLLFRPLSFTEVTGMISLGEICLCSKLDGSVHQLWCAPKWSVSAPPRRFQPVLLWKAELRAASAVDCTASERSGQD